jgi:hypothetical protein
LGAGKGGREKEKEDANTHSSILNESYDVASVSLIGMLHNTSVKSYASIPAFVASAVLHAALFMAILPTVTVRYAAHGGGVASEGLRNAILGFGLAWCLVVAIWSGLATHILRNSDNKWGGVRGLQLVGVVAGLTLALDLANSFCLFSCPATALALPILTIVALYNNSQKYEPDKNLAPPG